MDAAHRVREQRVACDATSDGGEIERLTVYVNDTDCDVGPAQQGRQRHAEGTARHQGRDGREFGAHRRIAGCRQREPVIVRQHERFEPTLVAHVLELKAEGEITLGAAAEAALYEDVHDAPK